MVWKVRGEYLKVLVEDWLSLFLVYSFDHPLPLALFFSSLSISLSFSHSLSLSLTLTHFLSLIDTFFSLTIPMPSPHSLFSLSIFLYHRRWSTALRGLWIFNGDGAGQYFNINNFSFLIVRKSGEKRELMWYYMIWYHIASCNVIL